jgi:ubiquinone/menaquinone biosynthesis C-methylase UbiE
MVDRPMLSHEDARRFYDRFGSKQDWQRFYEEPAIQDLFASAAFPEASAVVEFGCGTGRVAETLLRKHLPKTATYLALDLSATMVALTRQRLSPFGARVRVVQTSGSPRLSEPVASCDRFISTYVLDLLSTDDIQQVLGEAHRLLQSGGLLGVAVLTHGATVPARLIERAWTWAHRWRPTSVGGCRPISLLEFMTSEWQVTHRAVVTSIAISSEVVVARKAV